MGFRIIDSLINKTVKEIKVNDDKDEMIFCLHDGSFVRFYHNQGCCESVNIEDIIGDLNDLIGADAPLLMAEEATETGEEEYGNTYTWTFYKFGTKNGYVTVRWYGCSNGYYSEDVDIQVY